LVALAEDSFSWDNSYRSGDYKKHWHLSIPSQELATFLATISVKKGRALDLGCGAGVETMYLAENGLRASGIDISNKAIGLAKASAQRRQLRIDFRTGTVLDLPYPDKTFSVFNDRGCLHNLDLEEWKSYASEAARVAKPGAYFLLRGASDREPNHEFTYLTQKRLEKYFRQYFTIGVPRHYMMISDAGTLQSIVAVQRRKI
jgi:ubiquinone/menaquinone biosynthesis C-methylase UbiE